MTYGYLASMTGLFLLRSVKLRLGFLVSSAIMCGVLVMTSSTTGDFVVIAATLAVPVLLLIAKLPRGFILAIAISAVLWIMAGLLGYLFWCAVTAADPTIPVRGMTFTARADIWPFLLGKRNL